MKKALILVVTLLIIAVGYYFLKPTDHSQQANQLFDEFYMARLALNPEEQSYFGFKMNQDSWSDFSETGNTKWVSLLKQQLKQLKNNINPENLNPETKLSYDLFVKSTQQEIRAAKYVDYDYIAHHMHGIQAEVPMTLIDFHSIDSLEDAKAYLSRLEKVKVLMKQVSESLKTSAKKGIILPKFLFPGLISESKNVISGQPLDHSKNINPIFADFKNKISKLKLSANEQEQLLASAKTALLNSFKPGYEQLIATLTQLETKATDAPGVWKHPEGRDYYDLQLELMTTTKLSADQIHQLGIKEVDRIQNEMKLIMQEVGFQGTLHDFFHFLVEDEQFYYPATTQGKQGYMKQAKAVINNMKGRLDELFNLKPKAALKVKAVEPFQEATTGLAFYSGPSQDGKRPGTYYVNLYDMKKLPTWELEALAYHEGIPGHHMQISIATELEGLPYFRKHGNYTAYIEGWGLYSELLPKEIGLYDDPYSNFGRLSMELWRATRLVVDTGLHAKKWTKAQAVKYLLENTPVTKQAAEDAVNRYAVLPGQATAYKIGMLKILELRKKAKTALGQCFDIKTFHDTVLKHGPLPLDTLDMIINDWIKQEKAICKKP